MVTHPPSTPKALLRRSPSHPGFPQMAERAMVPGSQEHRTPLFPGDEPLLPLTTNVPSPQIPVDHQDSNRGRRGSDLSGAPDAGYPTPGETRALQLADRNTP